MTHEEMVKKLNVLYEQAARLRIMAVRHSSALAEIREEFGAALDRKTAQTVLTDLRNARVQAADMVDTLGELDQVLSDVVDRK